MDKIKIKGNADLYGSIAIPGSKNASLPILVSSLLCTKELNLSNVPNLEDIKSMTMLLKNFGVECKIFNARRRMPFPEASYLSHLYLSALLDLSQ